MFNQKQFKKDLIAKKKEGNYFPSLSNIDY